METEGTIPQGRPGKEDGKVQAGKTKTAALSRGGKILTKDRFKNFKKEQKESQKGGRSTEKKNQLVPPFARKNQKVERGRGKKGGK